eukprot:6195677-Pleurochrysis_carterae.AAC.2
MLTAHRAWAPEAPQATAGEMSPSSLTHEDTGMAPMRWRRRVSARICRLARHCAPAKGADLPDPALAARAPRVEPNHARRRGASHTPAPCIAARRYACPTCCAPSTLQISEWPYSQKNCRVWPSAAAQKESAVIRITAIASCGCPNHQVGARASYAVQCHLRAG